MSTQDQTSVLDALVEGSRVRLPSLPEVGLKIVEACRREDFRSDELASIISSDPALAMKTISVANSALYTSTRQVSSIEQAIFILGAHTLKNIALSFVIIDNLNKNGNKGFDNNRFWKRCITSAVAAEAITQKTYSKWDGAFVTALLMDVGIMVIFMCRPDDYLRIMEEKIGSEKGLETVERDILGYDHQEIGMEFLKSWGLPEDIYMPIAYQHSTEGCPSRHAKSAAILEVSHLASSMYHGSRSVERQKELKGLLKGPFKLDETRINSFIEEVAEKTLEVISTFEIPPGEMKPYSQILQEANEELSALNFTYDQLVAEFRQSQERAEMLAMELRGANKRLEELAYKDSVTGLYNHRFFYEMIEKEISRAERHSREFSLVLCDIDEFKDINDSCGHRFGDAVLERFGKALLEFTRRSDMAARFGGDEFAVLLADTGVRNAELFAEKLRTYTEKLSLDYNGKAKSITISLGVGVYKPGSGKNKDHLFEEVDKALYDSKKLGRNRVTTA